jgi:hypothetical protein
MLLTDSKFSIMHLLYEYCFISDDSQYTMSFPTNSKSYARYMEEDFIFYDLNVFV